MPWKEESPMVQRMRFVRDYEEGLFGMAELAERYGISRKTGYKWLKRFEEEGEAGLMGRPCVALEVANRTEEGIEAEVVACRRKYGWGPKKLLEVLKRRSARRDWPARSTVAEILKRHGLVTSRRHRRREGHGGKPQTVAGAPNEIWAGDFKGQFLTRDGRYCYPLTVTDLFSRYLLVCDGQLSTSWEPVQTSLERVFREHGLPDAFRSDNGSPFASIGIGRLTQLGVWLLKLGIRRELIEPGKPTQNGCHERMHRTLKAEATLPPEANLRRQQRRFDEFRERFNTERPHEGIGMKRPADLYKNSLRPYRGPQEPEYPGHYEVRRVSRNGGVRWKGEWVNVGHALVEQDVGFEEVNDGLWDMYFSSYLIGRFDERELTLVGTLATHYRCGKRGDRQESPATD